MLILKTLVLSCALVYSRANTLEVGDITGTSAPVMFRPTESEDDVEVFVPADKGPKIVLHPWRSDRPASQTYMAKLTAQNMATTLGGRWQAVVDFLPDSIKNTLMGMPTNISDNDLKRLDTASIGALSQELLTVLNSTQVVTIISGFQEKKSYRDAAKAFEVLGKALKTSQVVQLVSQVQPNNRCDRDVQAMFRQALRYLDTPDNWNSQLWMEKKYDTIAPLLPADLLMRVEDQGVARRLLARLSNGNDGSFGCGMTGVTNPSGASVSEQIVHINRVMLKLIMAAYGRQSEWTPEVLRNYSAITDSMTIQSLLSIKASVIGETIPDLSLNTDWDDAQGYTLASRWAENTGYTFNTMTDSVFGRELDSLGQIMPFFVPELLPRMNMSQSDTLVRSWADAMDRWRNQGGRLPPRTASALLQYKLHNMPAITAMTLQDFNRLAPSNMGPSILKVGPRTLLNAAEKVGFLTSDVLRRLVADDSGGMLRKGDLRRLGTLAVKANRIGNKLDIRNMPGAYLPSTPASDMQSLSASELIDSVKALNENAGALSVYQVFTVFSKVRETKTMVDIASAGFGPVFKDMFPVNELKASGLTLANIASFASDMPADSPTRLAYSQMKMGNKDLTYTDLQKDPLLVATLTTARIANINLQDTPDIAWTVRNAAQGPSVQTIRTLQSKLKSYTKVRRVDIADSDSSILENTWLSNIDLYPATVIASFSSDALTNTNDAKKVEILRGLGDLPLADYYSIPKSKRRVLIQNGLKALGKNTGELTDADVVLLGNAVLDLGSSEIKRLSYRSLEYALPILQGQSEIFPGLLVRPCLTADQRSAIFDRLKASYGNPGSWNSGVMDVVCCSLDLVPKEQLSSISQDVVLECRCVVDNEPPAYLTHLRDSLNVNCLAELGGSLGGLTEGLQNVKRRKAEAALSVQSYFMQSSTSSGNMYYGRRKRGVIPMSCDVVTLSQFGASGFTPTQLDTLREDDMRNCLYELGVHELSKEQAETLVKRLIFTYKSVVDIPSIEAQQMGWIARAMNATLLGGLDMSDSDVIASLGVNRKFEKDQLQALATLVENNYGTAPLGSFNSQEFVMLGYILCGYTPDKVRGITAVSYMGASVRLGRLYGCDPAVLSALASVATSAAAYGDPSTWDAATVRTVGVVIGGLRAEQLSSIPNESLAALTPKAVASIDPQNFKAFKTEQLRAFPLAAAQAITPDQRNVLIGEMSAALNWVVYGDSSGSASLIMSSSTACLVIMTFQFLMYAYN